MNNPLKLIRKPFKYTFNNSTLAVIVINVAVYLLLNIFPYYKVYLSLNVYNCLVRSMWWQPFTYMFVHSNVSHIFFNMLGLLFFGIAVERALGSKEFILLYLLCGLICGVVALVVYYFWGYYRVFLLGASGALYAVLLTYAVIFPRNIIYIWGILPVPAPILILAYAVIEFFSQFSASSNVAHMVHLTGFCAAWLYLVVRMGINPIRVWKNAYRN